MRTFVVTFACGLGHVGSSVLLGAVGYAASVAVADLVFIESCRGDLAAYAFVLFGLLYMIWGLRRAIRNRPHRHKHVHRDGTVHLHGHTHDEEHDHPHKKNITPWILFTIFVLGPCEPLIPVLMYPAAQKSTAGMLFIAGIFSVVTIATMVAVVLVTTYGLNMMRVGRLERWSHAMAGAIVFLSGIAIMAGL